MEYLEEIEDAKSLSQYFIRSIEKEFNDDITFKIKYRLAITPPMDKDSKEVI